MALRIFALWCVLVSLAVPAGDAPIIFAGGSSGAEEAAPVAVGGDVGGAGRGADEVSGIVARTEVRGMTVSTPRGNSEWAGDEMVGTLDELQAMGVNWVAIHPYGRIGTDGTVSWSWPRRRRRGGATEGERGSPPPANSPAALGGPPGAAEAPPGAPDSAPRWLRRPIEEAHRRGLKIMVKPHLANWRDYAWRGDISYETDEAWNRFFTTYAEWIVAMAAFAEGADAFVVGTELGGTTEHEASWREIITSVREVYDGPLTYAANWDAYERVSFWDALDSVGIQAYFPVLDEPSAGGHVPSQAVLDAGWEDIRRRVAAFSRRVGKPVIFTEVGYNNSPAAAIRPWDWQADGDAEELQVRCMIAAFRAIDAEPAIEGAFLWKWYPGNRLPRDFAMAAPRIRRLIADHWGSTQERP